MSTRWSDAEAAETHRADWQLRLLIVLIVCMPLLRLLSPILWHILLPEGKRISYISRQVFEASL